MFKYKVLWANGKFRLWPLVPFKKTKTKTGTPKNCTGSAVSQSCVTLAEFKQAGFNEKNIKSLTCVGAASSPWQQAYFPESHPLAASTPLLPPPLHMETQFLHDFPRVRVRLCGEFDPVCWSVCAQVLSYCVNLSVCPPPPLISL